jgi:O-methyltransferase involved in polyketide biosynthesis
LAVSSLPRAYSARSPRRIVPDPWASRFCSKSRSLPLRLSASRSYMEDGVSSDRRITGDP